jgi:tetraacyldisaccharide 4'-kinase
MGFRTYLASVLTGSREPLWFYLWARPLAWLYGWLLTCRPPYGTGGRLPGQTLAVGNITLGGTGKTPVVAQIVRYLKAQGARPAILTRGYKSGLKKNEFCLLYQGELFFPQGITAKKFTADEPFYHSAQNPQVPIILGARRYEAALWFLSQHRELAEGITHWILEDGFQQRSVFIDQSWVLLDSKAPLGNGRLLPSGTLREKPTALKNADHILWTRTASLPPDTLAEIRDIPQWPIPFETTYPFFWNNPEKTLDPKTPFCFIAAIANPKRALEELAQMGLTPQTECLLMDHSPIQKHHLRGEPGYCLVTTMKDFYRDQEVFQKDLHRLYLMDTKPLLPPALLRGLFLEEERQICYNQK